MFLAALRAISIRNQTGDPMARFTILAICIAVLPTTTVDGWADAIQEDERKYQDHIFKKWWDVHLERRFDRLPTEGKVPDYRIPYSGCDYPDTNGGIHRERSS